MFIKRLNSNLNNKHPYYHRNNMGVKVIIVYEKFYKVL